MSSSIQKPHNTLLECSYIVSRIRQPEEVAVRKERYQLLSKIRRVDLSLILCGSSRSRASLC